MKRQIKLLKKSFKKRIKRAMVDWYINSHDMVTFINGLTLNVAIVKKGCIGPLWPTLRRAPLKECITVEEGKIYKTGANNG